MSTKAIREALDTLEAYADTDKDWEDYRLAVAAVEAIERVVQDFAARPLDPETRVALFNLAHAIAKEAA
jgi:hypothetical protein